MTCAECQQLRIDSLDQPLPEAVSAHLLECATCRQSHQASETVKLLMSLKRFETPDPHFETRNAARVREAIANQEPASAGFFQSLLNLIQRPPAMALRAATIMALGASFTLIWAVRPGTSPLPQQDPGVTASSPINDSDHGFGATPAVLAEGGSTIESNGVPVDFMEPLTRPPALPAANR